MEKQNNIVKTQVIIVGAGPTGLSMAAQLLRYKIDFIIIERNKNPTHLSKAVVVQARTLEIFREIGLTEKAITEGRITTAINLFYKGKQKVAVDLAGLGDGLSPFPYVLSLEQSKTERLLADQLYANQIEIHWGCDFTRLEQTDDRVTVYYKNSNGQDQIIEGLYLVGCDGASSMVRHQLGLSFEGDTVPKIFYVTDVKLKSPVINKNELFMFMIKQGFVLFFPMEGNGHYRIIGILPDTKNVDEEFTFADIEDTVKQHIVVPVDFKEVLWFSSYKVHSRKAGSFENKRCYLAGDAAHIHTPAGGQGMNTGIQDAYNLAWKIAYTIKGEVKTNVLQTYNSERSENAKHLLQTTDRVFDIMAGTNPLGNFIRLHIMTRFIGLLGRSASLKKRIFPFLSQIGIKYPANCLIVNSAIGKVKAGVRMPFFIFSEGKQIFDFLSEPSFKILFFGDDEKNKSQQLSDIKIKIARYSFKEIPAFLFGNETNFYILLRPDNHISYIGKEINKCRELLEKISFN
jgi:2-polyprenyl-6-methoxyphenol hydroxylase-like FAD-dependent oxidoreductase